VTPAFQREGALVVTPFFESGIWNLEFGTCLPAGRFGIWNLEFGIWNFRL